jgi:hypothetical protein
VNETLTVVGYWPEPWPRQSGDDVKENLAIFINV